MPDLGYTLRHESTATVDQVIAYENGEMDDDEMAAFFQELVDSGLAFTLQGSYGRTARDMIQAGYVTDTHNVLGG
jgi:hypothetical protein